MNVSGGNHSHRHWLTLALVVSMVSLPVFLRPSSGAQGVSVQVASQRGRIAAGDAHTCAIATNHVVWCWGDNSYSQLGSSAHATLQRSEVPVQAATLPGGRIARQITAGRGHTCVLADDGTVWCWGDNGYEEVGVSGGAQENPVQVTLPSTATAVAAGGSFTCAVLSTRAVSCWGRNNRGQLGHGATSMSATPSAVMSIPSSFEVASLELGAIHACAVSTTGEVWCWGAFDHGRLGISVGSDVLTPQKSSAFASGSTSALSAGSSHTCAVATSALQCFGANTDGQLGTDPATTTSSFMPVSVALPATPQHVTTGSEFSCALLSTTAVHCFGLNSNSQLGDGGTTSRHTASVVTGLSTGVVDVVAGASHACAAMNTGAVMCWGANSFGQVGNNSTSTAASATQVGGLNVAPTTTSTSTSSSSSSSSSSSTSSTTTTTAPPTAENPNASSSPQIENNSVSGVPSTTSPVKRSAFLRVKRTGFIGARTIAAHVALAIPKTSQGTMRLSIVSGARNCQFAGTRVRGVRKGSCTVLVTVIPKRGKRVLKTAKIVVS